MSGRKAKKVQQPEEEEDDIEEISTAGGEGMDPRALLASDPRLLAGLQAQLMGMIGRDSGLYDSLPAVVKTRVKALKKIQQAHVQLELEFHRKVALLEQEYAAKFAELYSKRKDIVLGDHEPTAEEADWVDDEEAEEGEEEGEGEEGKGEKKEEGADADVKGIPKFWLTALQNNDAVAEMIQEYDVPILESLQDITTELSQEPNSGFKLHFHFADNEHFTNKVLTKTYVLDPSLESDKDLIYDGPILKSTSGTPIDWKKGKDVTVKTIRKKQKKKGGAGAGQTRTVVKTVPQPSFFAFFSPPSMDEESDPDHMDEVQQVVHRDYSIGEALKERVIPGAVLWFTGEALDYEDYDMGEGGYGEDMGEEEGEEEDPDYKPPPRGGEQPPECKQA